MHKKNYFKDYYHNQNWSPVVVLELLFEVVGSIPLWFSYCHFFFQSQAYYG
jgi:hypothetical protein